MCICISIYFSCLILKLKYLYIPLNITTLSLSPLKVNIIDFVHTHIACMHLLHSLSTHTHLFYTHTCTHTLYTQTEMHVSTQKYASYMYASHTHIHVLSCCRLPMWVMPPSIWRGKNDDVKPGVSLSSVQLGP